MKNKINIPIELNVSQTLTTKKLKKHSNIRMCKIKFILFLIFSNIQYIVILSDVKINT